ncbi:MAG: CAP domain-containing protein [Actinobacteria bacterium]|nr:CAP domain-containing protein [Actinomycetota bacterium]
MALAAPCASVAPAPTDEATMMRLLNGVRARAGLAPVALERTLARGARVHSMWMAGTGQLQHQVRDGQLTWNTSYSVAGENLAMAQGVTTAFRVLMNSPPHRENMLSKRWRAAAVGAAVGCSNTFFTIQFVG